MDGISERKSDILFARADGLGSEVLGPPNRMDQINMGVQVCCMRTVYVFGAGKKSAVGKGAPPRAECVSFPHQPNIMH